MCRTSWICTRQGPRAERESVHMPHSLTQRLSQFDNHLTTRTGFSTEASLGNKLLLMADHMPSRRGLTENTLSCIFRGCSSCSALSGLFLKINTSYFIYASPSFVFMGCLNIQKSKYMHLYLVFLCLFLGLLSFYMFCPILVWFYLLIFCYYPLDACCGFFLMREGREEMNLDGMGTEQSRAEGGETIIRIYCIEKIIFNNSQ